MIHLDGHADAHAEARSYFPPSSVFALGPDAYLEQIRRIRAAVQIPVIGSLNGATPGGWLTYARLIEEAGAHALELNLDPSAYERGNYVRLLQGWHGTVGGPAASTSPGRALAR